MGAMQMVRWMALAISLIQATVAFGLDASALWVLDGRDVKRIDLATNQFVQAISLPRAAEDLAFDARENIVWVLSSKHLWKFSAAGALLSDFDLNPLLPPGDALQYVALDPHDGGVWVADDKRSVFRISAQGTIAPRWIAPQDVRSITLDPDRSLWVLTDAAVYHLSQEGAVVQSASIPAVAMPDPSAIAVDGWGDYVWIAGKTHLIRLSSADLALAPLVVTLPPSIAASNPIHSILVRPMFGTLWITSTQVLLVYERDGSLARTVPLSNFGFGRGPFLAFDNPTSSLWVGGGKAIGRFTPSGDFVASPPQSVDVSAMASRSFRIVPTLSLIQPAPGTITANPRPLFRLGLGAECNGASCLPVGYGEAFSISALLNQQPVAAGLLSRSGAEAAFTPALPLPEGSSVFAASATDAFGQVSNSVQADVMVDTVAPSLGALTPPDGSTASGATVAVSGAFDEPAVTTIRDAAGNVIFAGQATFNANLTLAPGLNAFTISGQDRAGNTTTIPYRLTYGIRVAIDSPADGASLGGDNVLVSGSVTGPNNYGVTVNGSMAAIDEAMGKFYANVALVQGTNVLTAVATTVSGQKDTRSVSVTSDGLSPPIRVDAKPVQAFAPFTSELTVKNRSPSAIEVAVNGTSVGSVDVDDELSVPITVGQPGLLAAHVVASNERGTLASKDLVLVGMDRVRADRTLRETWRSFADALIARDRVQALTLLSPPSQPKYGPVFDALADNLPAIAGSFSPLASSSLDEDLAEYVVVRPAEDGTRAYFVYFVRHSDGVWRIDEL